MKDNIPKKSAEENVAMDVEAVQKQNKLHVDQGTSAMSTENENSDTHVDVKIELISDTDSDKSDSEKERNRIKKHSKTKKFTNVSDAERKRKTIEHQEKVHSSTGSDHEDSNIANKKRKIWKRQRSPATSIISSNDSNSDSNKTLIKRPIVKNSKKPVKPASSSQNCYPEDEAQPSCSRSNIAVKKNSEGDSGWINAKRRRQSFDSDSDSNNSIHELTFESDEGPKPRTTVRYDFHFFFLT